MIQVKEVEVVPKPTCDVCKKRVDSLEYFYRPDIMSTAYKVKCHGAVEECYISDDELYDITLGSIEGALAFTTKQLH